MNEFEAKTTGAAQPGRAPACSICGSAYASGAHFCHVCGSGRQEQPRGGASLGWLEAFGIEQWRERTGLSGLSLGMAIAALVCLTAAALTTLVYRTPTVAEWQAVQFWRIEWLLATIAATAGAILLKKA